MKNTNIVKQSLELYKAGYRIIPPKENSHLWYLMNPQNQYETVSPEIWRLIRNLEKQAKKSTGTT